jgi:hypothetical protein
MIYIATAWGPAWGMPHRGAHAGEREAPGYDEKFLERHLARREEDSDQPAGVQAAWPANSLGGPRLAGAPTSQLRTGRSSCSW